MVFKCQFIIERYCFGKKKEKGNISDKVILDLMILVK